MHKTIYRTSLLVLFLLTLLAAGCGGAPVELGEAEEAAVYAAAIRQIYREDDTFGGTLQPERLYILGSTDDRAGAPTDGEANAAPIPVPVRQAVTAALSDLPTEIIWVESREDVELDPNTGAVEGQGALITLGNISPENADLLHLPASIYVAGLAAGGQTYVVENVDGTWTITGNTGAQWIS